MTGFSVGRIVGRRVVQVLPAAFLAASLCCGTAAAEVTEQEAKRQVEEAYDVEVLKVREGEIDGRAVWLVTVMLPQGDFNTTWSPRSATGKAATTCRAACAATRPGSGRTPRAARPGDSGLPSSLLTGPEPKETASNRRLRFTQRARGCSVSIAR
jgi:hypothetical protein